MGKIINFLFGSYLRKVILHVIVMVILFRSLPLMEKYPVQLGVVYFFTGGLLALSGVLLGIEYIRILTSGINTARLTSYSDDNFDQHSMINDINRGNYETDYVGPHICMGLPLFFIMFFTLAAVLVGILFGIAMIIEGFGNMQTLETVIFWK